MNGGILPLLLMGATLGLALSLLDPRAALACVAAWAAAALLLSFVPIPAVGGQIAFAGLWLSVIATAALLYLPATLSPRWMVAVAANGGAWAGAVVALGEPRLGLIPAIMLCLLFIPGRWAAEHGLAIGTKIVASWMIAIASLSLFVSQMPTPGYVKDHME